MALKPTFPLDTSTGYGFEWLRYATETLLNSEGVVNYATDYVVTAGGAGLTVDIAAGAAWVKGDSGTPGVGLSQGLYLQVNDAAVTTAVTLAAAHATLPRIDQIFLEVRDSADLGGGVDTPVFGVITGTPTAAATLLNRNGAGALGNNRLLLADVQVDATATSLTAPKVRDRRIPANGKATKYISTLETTTSTSFVDLATPDIIDVYVPPNGMVDIMHRNMAKSTVADNSRGQLYVIDRQTGTDAIPTATNTTNAAVSNGEQLGYGRTDFYTRGVLSQGAAYLGWATQGIGGVSADVTFGNQIGHDHVTRMVLPGGRVYGFAMRFRNTAAATLSVKERLTMVQVVGHGRSA